MLLRTGGRLPALKVMTRDGTHVSLRPSGRTARVVVAVHPECDECAAWIRSLEAHADAVREWDGRVIVVASGDAPVEVEHFVGAAATPAALHDAGIPLPAVLIADQWGELFEVADAGATHGFPAPDDVVAWLRYLAVVCPECQGEAL